MVGFACAVGLDMGFNSSHHDEEAMEVADNHGDHEHHSKTLHDHHHDKNDDDSDKSADNCCNHHVVNLSQLDKAVPQSFKLNGPNVFSISFIPVFYFLSGQYHSGFIKSPLFYTKSHHPPIPDIRVAIRSFQI